jgi:predicted MFS family arabinose efflux permease
LSDPTPTIAQPQSVGVKARAPRRIVWLLAVAGGLTVANLYYSQPLLPAIAKTYHAAQASTGALVTASQMGYAAALFLVVPLGDITRRRRLVCGLLILEAAALAASAAAPNLGMLLAAGAGVGIAACVVQILLPYAATIAADHERGRVVATVLTGVLVGILLSRAAAGLLGQLFGWRSVFVVAAVLMVLLAGILARAMDGGAAEVRIGYRDQLRATGRLARAEPVLRRRALIGACVFAAFGLFWATAPFLLAGPPYRYNQAGIGLFALVGGAGAITAQLTGRAADRGYQRSTTGLLLAVGAASFGAIWLGGSNVAWLIVGVLLMDMAVQGVHLLNMSVVYALSDGARSRIASVYMTIYFLGGALGSVAGTQAYRAGGWAAVSAVGAVFIAVGLGVWVRDSLAAGKTAQPSGSASVQPAANTESTASRA